MSDGSEASPRLLETTKTTDIGSMSNLKNRWFDFVTDPKTVIGFLSGALSVSVIAGSWIFNLVSLDLKKLKLISDSVEISDDRMTFKKSYGISFKVADWYYLLQNNGNIAVFDGDPNDPKDRKSKFTTKFIQEAKDY